MAETLTLRGELKAHRGWVTAIAPPLDPNSDVLLTSSRYVFEYICSSIYIYEMGGCVISSFTKVVVRQAAVCLRRRPKTIPEAERLRVSYD
jgi:hypothetical protein